jgi:hypothetical protein
MNTTVDISGFNRGMTGFVDRLGIEARVVLKKEMGELVKTLVKITPGADVAKLKGFNESQFEKVSDSNNSNLSGGHGGGRMGKSGILWYNVDSNFLRGIAPEKDMRSASAEELKALSYQITKRGHALNLPFQNRKTSQRVLLAQTILTRASTVKKMITLKLKNRGRLKAGWLAAWDFLSPGGGNQPPQWVTRHKSGAHGYFVDGLGVKDHPVFTIANYATGVGNSKNNLDWLVQKALNIRAKAMQVNLGLFMRGKKHLSDYARA